GFHGGTVRKLEAGAASFLAWVGGRPGWGGSGHNGGETPDDRRYDAPSAHQPPLAESSLSGGRFSVRVSARRKHPPTSWPGARAVRYTAGDNATSFQGLHRRRRAAME